MGKGKRGSGFGTTLVLAFVIVVLSIALGVGLAGGCVPLLGPLFGGETGPRPARWSSKVFKG